MQTFYLKHLLNTSSQNETNVSEDQISVNAVTGNQYSKNIRYLLITQAQGELESWVGTWLEKNSSSVIWT